MYIDGVWFSWSVPVLDSENPTSTKEASEAIGYKLRRVRGESEITNPWKNRVPSLNLHEHVVTMSDSTINSWFFVVPQISVPKNALSRVVTVWHAITIKCSHFKWKIKLLSRSVTVCHGLALFATKWNYQYMVHRIPLEFIPSIYMYIFVVGIDQAKMSYFLWMA